MSLVKYLIEQFCAGRYGRYCLTCLARAAGEDPTAVRTEIADIGKTLAIDARKGRCARCGRSTRVYGFRRRAS